MHRHASDIAFTSAVKGIQTEKGSRKAYARAEKDGWWETTVTTELSGFISNLDMFYLGTASADGQPYIQYRGGRPGFLKTIDERTLGFADFAGNRQYVSIGNLSENPRASIFLMDYVNSRRIKVWGKARVVEDDRELLDRLRDEDYPGRPERAILFTVEAWDVNCQQHIHKRLLQSDVASVVDELRGQIRDLQERLVARESGMTSSHT